MYESKGSKVTASMFLLQYLLSITPTGGTVENTKQFGIVKDGLGLTTVRGNI